MWSYVTQKSYCHAYLISRVLSGLKQRRGRVTRSYTDSGEHLPHLLDIMGSLA
jgi:hypothetical protein